MLLSVQNFRFMVVGAFWFVLTSVSIFSSGFTESVFYCSFFIKPFFCLSIWVGAMMLLASVPIFQGGGDNWFLVGVSSLTVFLLFALSSSTLMFFYFFFESTLLPTLLLIYGWGNQPERLQAAMYLLIYTVFGSLPLLLAISVISESGWFFLYGFVAPLSVFSGFSFFSSGVLWVVVMGAFMIKLPMYPMHLWLPKAHVEAPLAGSMALAGILLKLGILGVMVLGYFVVFPVGVSSLVLGLSLWGSVVTSVICARQVDMKSLIAYSSIGHMGLALAGLLSTSELGVKGAIVVAVAHGLSSPAMFSFASITYDVTFSRSIFLCKGVGALFPVVLFPFFILCASNMSAPPFVNLVGEVWLIISVSAFSSWSSSMIGAMCFLVGVYTLYLYTAISHGSGSHLANPAHLYSSSNYLILFMQIWPIFVLVMNLYVLFY